MSVHHIFASHLMRLMGWTDRSTLDLYGEDLQVEPATETKRRRGSLIPAGQVP